MKNNLGINRLLNPREYLNYSQTNDRLLFLCRIINTAPSSHNTQPWKFILQGKSLSIEPRLDRLLVAGDPEARELWLSMGAVISCALRASTAYGFKYTIDYKESGGAVLHFNSLDVGEIDYSTLNAIILRHCNRSHFNVQPLSTSLVDAINRFVTAPEELRIFQRSSSEITRKLEQVVIDATQEAFASRDFTKELSNWIRPSWPKYEDGMPGYYMGIPFLLSFFVPWLVRNTDTTKLQLNMIKDMFNCYSAIAVISGDDSLESRRRAGEAFYNISLECQKQGANLSVYGAPIEIGQHYKRLQELVNTNKRPLMFLRMGYATKINKNNYSPRLNVFKNSEIIK